MTTKLREVENVGSEVELLSIEEMLDASDVEYRVIQNCWNGKPLRIRSLTAEDIADWRVTSDDPAAKRTMGVRLFVKSLVDKQGNPIGNEDHAARFQKKNNAIMERVIDAILELNGLTKKAQADSKKD